MDRNMSILPGKPQGNSQGMPHPVGTKDSDFIAWINATLRAPEREYFTSETLHPTVHILGLPRSGTTLASQLLVRHLDIGYVSNLAAMFGSAPATGVRMQKFLGLRPGQAPLESTFGKTHSLDEPHEFGYFWRDLLGNDGGQEEPTQEQRDAVDWPSVRDSMARITGAWGGPVLFKPFILAWYAKEFVSQVSSSYFLWVQRDLTQICISMWEMYKQQGENSFRTQSLQPSSIGKDPLERVVRQASLLHEALERNLARVPAERLVRVAYADLCTNPAGLIDVVQNKMAMEGAHLNRLSWPPAAQKIRTWDAGKDPDHRRIADLVASMG